ncbi:unnamed protein product [Lactuca virosa]|uniref:Uncharacterized protein n=1 Tax=Lactuca virosa TaxID=75947 RepID=A0AAU9LW97_9ASTR|nr:unnamed protein product [Lactuca virosa]
MVHLKMKISLKDAQNHGTLTQFFEKYRATKPYRLPSGDRESEKRTPEQMSNYLKIAQKHKRSRAVFMEEQTLTSGSPMFDSGQGQTPDDELFFPETMFSANSVPDSALPLSNQLENVHMGKCNGVLDNLPLPLIMTKSPIMLERLGIRPEYLNMEQQGGLDRGKNGTFGMKNGLSSQQASEMSRQMVSRLLIDVGFESASEKIVRLLVYLRCSSKQLDMVTLRLLPRLLKIVPRTTFNKHKCKFKQCRHKCNYKVKLELVNPINLQDKCKPNGSSSTTTATVGPHAKASTCNSNPRGVGVMNMNLDNESQRSMVEVKLENPSDFQMDNNNNNNNGGFATMNYRNPQMQFRQQQFAAMSAYQAQNNQFRPMASVQIPQLHPQAHSPNMGMMVRAPPVKVEAFQELMGGDSSMKHDSDESKLTSPN